MIHLTCETCLIALHLPPGRLQPIVIGKCHVPSALKALATKLPAKQNYLAQKQQSSCHAGWSAADNLTAQLVPKLYEQ